MCVCIYIYIYTLYIFIWNSSSDPSIEIENRLMVAGGYGQSVDGRETDAATVAT